MGRAGVLPEQAGPLRPGAVGHLAGGKPHGGGGPLTGQGAYGGGVSDVAAQADRVQAVRHQVGGRPACAVLITPDKDHGRAAGGQPTSCGQTDPAACHR